MKTPASYIPHQTVSSANFPFTTKQLGSRPKSHIGLPSLEPNTQVSVTPGGGHDRQTHSPGVPVTQSPVSQHKLSLQQLQPQASTAVSNSGADLQNINQDMHRLSLDPSTLEQARLAKQTKIATQTTVPSVIKSASSGSLSQQQQGTSGGRPAVSAGTHQGGEWNSESGNYLGSSATGHQVLYQQDSQGAVYSVQDGVYNFLF